MYSYVATSVKPTAVHHALVCQFTSSNDKNLIIGRGNHIEVHTFKENGLQQEQDISLFGRISSMACYRPAGLDQDVLFVLTERKTFCILGYDNVNRKFITRASGNLKDRVGRELEYGYRTTVDPDGRMIGISIYQGTFKILPISGQNLKEAFNVRLEMLTYCDIKFLYGCPRPTLCVLFEDNRRGKHIRTQIVDQRDKELQNGPWQHDNLDSTAHTLIPVSSPIHGVIVVGDRVIMYLNGSGTLQSVVTDTSRMVTYCAIDADGTRYLLGDTNGVLYVLMLHTMNTNGILTVRSLSFDRVGVTSIPENLCYLDNGLLYVGSVFGNSQLIKLHAPSTATTNTMENANKVTADVVEVLEVYPNIGPIVDMCVVQAERKGQNRVVTCSGAFKDGSLRVISSGVGIQEQVSCDLLY